MAPWFSRRRFLATLGVSAALATRPAHALEAPLRLGGTGAGLGTLKRLGALYMERHPGRAVTVLPSTGSSGGIRAVADGALDIAFSARPLLSEERNPALEAVPVLRTPVALVTSHPGTRDVSREDLFNIYTNRMQTWADGVPIRIILRPKSELVLVALAKAFPELSAPFEAARQRREHPVANTDQENLALVERLPGSLGIAVLAQVMTEAAGVHVLALNGVMPTVETLASGRYPCSQDLYLITRRDTAGAAAELATFMRGAAAARLLKEIGSLPLTGGT